MDIGQDKLTAYEKSLGAKPTGDNGLFITTPEDREDILTDYWNLVKKTRIWPEVLHTWLILYLVKEFLKMPRRYCVAHKMGALNDSFMM